MEELRDPLEELRQRMEESRGALEELRQRMEESRGALEELRHRLGESRGALGDLRHGMEESDDAKEAARRVIGGPVRPRELRAGSPLVRAPPWRPPRGRRSRAGQPRGR